MILPLQLLYLKNKSCLPGYIVIQLILIILNLYVYQNKQIDCSKDTSYLCIMYLLHTYLIVNGCLNIISGVLLFYLYTIQLYINLFVYELISIFLCVDIIIHNRNLIFLYIPIYSCVYIPGIINTIWEIIKYCRYPRGICEICFSDGILDGILLCGHSFHRECIRFDSCPICSPMSTINQI